MGDVTALSLERITADVSGWQDHEAKETSPTNIRRRHQLQQRIIIHDTLGPGVAHGPRPITTVGSHDGAEERAERPRTATAGHGPAQDMLGHARPLLDGHQHRVAGDPDGAHDPAPLPAAEDRPPLSPAQPAAQLHHAG